MVGLFFSVFAISRLPFGTVLPLTADDASKAELSALAEKAILSLKLSVVCFGLWFSIVYNVHGRERGVSKRMPNGNVMYRKIQFDNAAVSGNFTMYLHFEFYDHVCFMTIQSITLYTCTWGFTELRTTDVDEVLQGTCVHYQKEGYLERVVEAYSYAKNILTDSITEFVGWLGHSFVAHTAQTMCNISVGVITFLLGCSTFGLMSFAFMVMWFPASFPYAVTANLSAW